MLDAKDLSAIAEIVEKAVQKSEARMVGLIQESEARMTGLIQESETRMVGPVSYTHLTLPTIYSV